MRGGLAILSLNPSLQMKLTDDYAAGNTDAHKSPVDERYRLVSSTIQISATIQTPLPAGLSRCGLFPFWVARAESSTVL